MIVILMGVAGSGKTTIGHLLAVALGATFRDGDDFHPPANVAKMSAGLALSDEDRAVWLALLAREVDAHARTGRRCVIACSALKGAYREQLRGGWGELVRFVFLKGSYALLHARLAARAGHFMAPTMLESQFAALEEPDDALAVSVDQTPEQIVAAVLAWLAPPSAA